MLVRLLGRLVVSAVLVFASSEASAKDTHAKTRYPIVLCHGMSGFDSVLGILDYWYGIDAALRDAGATVYVAQVSPFDSPEKRGEELLEQIEEISARTGAAKLNLIAHSQGGFDARYVSAVRPDLVASVTTVGTPHDGAELADILRRNLKPGGFAEGVLSYFAGSFGMVLGILTGHRTVPDAVAALDSLTRDGAAVFNRRYPAGLASSRCGTRRQAGSQRFYSWSGTASWTHLFDSGDPALKLVSGLYGEDNDGLVGQCASHFGEVIRDNFRMNHLDEVNQIMGMVSLFETNPRTVYRTHGNRLKLAGL